MKKILKLILVMLLTLSLCVPSFADNDKTVVNTGDDFTDIDASHYAYEAINTMKDYGIISGYKDGTFRPSETVTRAEFATMMVRALKLDVDKHAVSSFTDLSKNNWAVPYVEAAKNYLTGYKTNAGLLFKPANASVREDMAVALIKALDKTADSDTTLKTYLDEADVSKNLRNFVSAAIDNKLMVGVTTGAAKYFYPVKTLTRAEAASLLMNVIREEKITFDADDKVVIDDDAVTPSVGNYEVPKVAVTLKGNYLNVSWDKIDDTRLQGYKVVASTKDKTPQYPENGYFQWITDLSTTNTSIKIGNSYHGGDVDKFKSGQTYYISITAVYDEAKIPGNVATVKMPGKTSDDDDDQKASDTSKILKFEKEDGKLKLVWTKSDQDNFQGYKVVASLSDSTPVYPENGYFKYITNRNENEITLYNGTDYKNGDFEELKAGKTYYFAITYLYDDGKQTSNVVKVEL